MRSFTPTKDLAIGYFGASTAAATLAPVLQAVVSRGGRPALAWAALKHVQAPTLLIVGGRGDIVIELNQRV
jgi:putative phosphoribosyl transferase